MAELEHTFITRFPSIEFAHEQIDIAIASAESTATKESYLRCLKRFVEWLGEKELSLRSVKAFKAQMLQEGKSSQNINQHIYAVRYFLRDLADREIIDVEQAEIACKVRPARVLGRKIGNWLTVPEAEAILNAPDTSTVQGMRDRAILAVMIGAGLRRSELVSLTAEHFEKKGGRWVINGLRGKHKRVRNIPVADWVKAAVDDWMSRSGITSGHLFRRVRESKKNQTFTMADEPLTPAMIYFLVKGYGLKSGKEALAPHDMRRTFARLAFEGEAPISQIQLALGHSIQATTERYINVQQDLDSAPSDLLGIEINI